MLFFLPFVDWEIKCLSRRKKREAGGDDLISLSFRGFAEHNRKKGRFCFFNGSLRPWDASGKTWEKDFHSFNLLLNKNFFLRGEIWGFFLKEKSFNKVWNENGFYYMKEKDKPERTEVKDERELEDKVAGMEKNNF